VLWSRFAEANNHAAISYLGDIGDDAIIVYNSWSR
jgi:hypothetical protein